MSITPKIENMSILQNFKTSHKNILNKITNIRNAENILYDNIHKFPNKKKSIINEINNLAIKRDKLFKAIQEQSGFLQNITPKITKEEKLVKEIETELSKLNYENINTNNIINNKRMIEINNYYNARSLSYINLFKTILIFFIPLIFIELLIYYNIIPYTLGKTLIFINIVIMIIYSLNRYLDILSRDNMNFNEYDFSNTK